MSPAEVKIYYHYTNEYNISTKTGGCQIIRYEALTGSEGLKILDRSSQLIIE